MRDIETIELRQLVAICNMVREVEGRPPSTDYIDALLDERRKLARASQFSNNPAVAR
jgi:acetyl-CoA carboxylase alpha subunit